MVKTAKVSGLLLLGFLFLCQSVSVWSQQDTETQFPVFKCDEMVHDFGKIREIESYAIHEFVIKNIGTAPLVINQVLSSCGCAQPEWSERPIEPGQEGFVIVVYDMIGRPGPFRKNITVFTNERKIRQVLTIMGDVISKPQSLNVSFRDSLGTVQLERRNFVFYNVLPQEIIDTEIWIANFGEEAVNVAIEDVPDFIRVTVPDRLESEYPERMNIEIDATKVDKSLRGRQIIQPTWKEIRTSGSTNSYTFSIAVNFIDDFTKLTAEEKANAPAIQLSTPSLEFGKLKKKQVYKDLTIKNTGKSMLHLHSITTDNPKARITGFKKNRLKPEETLKLRVYVNPNDYEKKFTTDLVIVCNDPNDPVSEVYILAEK
jgi:hypothetical protein